MHNKQQAPDQARVDAAIAHLQSVHRLCLLRREIEALELEAFEKITPFPPRDLPALAQRQAT